MLRLLKWLFYLVVTVAIIVLGGSFLLPSEAVVTRSTEIAAPPEKVFAIVSDLHRFQEYSPWAELDPNAKYTYEGPATGLGQKMSWSSTDPNVGSGSQTVTEFDPPRHVASELDFGPMGKATATWDLEPSGTGTKATWGFRSKLDGIAARWFGLMFDKWIGADYEKGLAKLKTVAEKPEPPVTEPAPSPEAPAQPAN
jgi:uncharacterized protein YndB with AHSA1/START domain